MAEGKLYTTIRHRQHPIHILVFNNRFGYQVPDPDPNKPDSYFFDSYFDTYPTPSKAAEHAAKAIEKQYETYGGLTWTVQDRK